jgi:protein O-GlcNAc transferase
LEYPADALPNLQCEAEACGVDPKRIVMTPKAKKVEHINRCYLADLALDNPITNGHTTSCDQLWSGLPMLTFALTDGMPSRVASSICAALECPEMICDSYDHYEKRAIKLAVGTMDDL